MKEVPAWVVFTPDGKEKERWYGDWKDAAGKPTMFAKTTQQEKPADMPVKTKPTPAPAKTSTTTSTTKSETSVSNTSTTSGFVVQAGYFGSEANATKLISDLHGKGFSSFTMKPESKNGSQFYRVISNTFVSETEASSWLDKLSGAGIKGSIKKTSEI